MKLLPLLAVPLLLAAPALATPPAQEGLPLWLAEALQARGVPEEAWGDVVVEGRAYRDGAWRPAPGRFADLGALAVAVPATPDVVVGTLSSHQMIQTSCAGYRVTPLAGGIDRVEGAWDLGIHVVLGPAAMGTGVDAREPTSPGSAHTDNGVAAIADVSIQETRLILFGNCLALLGTMSGVGVFAFDQTFPA